MPPRISPPLLCYVTDRRSLGNHSDLIGRIGQAASAGIQWIQIREKDLPTRELLALVQQAVALAEQKSVRDSPTRIIVNDRLDVALAARAAGVHMSELSAPVAAVNEWRRKRVSTNAFMVGASCHSVEGAKAAARDGADYLFFGPVFATPSKAMFGAPQGLKQLKDASHSVEVPVLAIGGITAENAHECVAAGAAGIAAIRLFQEAKDLPALVAGLQAAP
ncbi:MAG TPA: thiamine phosphate synthase [Candidatus Acidoferrales bacterium]|nr:thiamine phosphate synthase [Candidatus Acidoferrales bacterium]